MTHNEIKQNHVTIPWSEQRAMRSRFNNHEYRIFVAKPNREAPPEGYPVIYLLDANSVFGTMADAIRLQARRTEKTGVDPAIIVGIGYKTDEPFSPQRFYDFTRPAPISELPQRPDGTPWPKQGGAEAFMSFIEAELKPAIERDYQIDRSKQTIFGHSLGGLFVVHTLFAKPTAFQTYVAGSPSLHWYKRILQEEEQQFIARLEQEPKPLDVNVLIAVGELEKAHKSGMNVNAHELSRRLSGLKHRGVKVEFEEFKNENHVSVLPVLISRAVRFATRSTVPTI
ncbi:alpha/beta hydrolase [Paenibacillus sp. 481]|uniref:alpha/beta hydrolase n=1 Tax=Paenibacillus sp. 481 TaxID=2835869 RepID=UPI001E2E60A2|nr:alpha/beta hydrolase [Paenibacillus sp. 481]UHA74838.1 alpha/beta hydrolase [Paenibacillus sp. 481]